MFKKFLLVPVILSYDWLAKTKNRFHQSVVYEDILIFLFIHKNTITQYL